LPFRDFSFVLKIRCEERGVTGVLKAVLLDENKAFASPRPTVLTEREQVTRRSSSRNRVCEYNFQ